MMALPSSFSHVSEGYRVVLGATTLATAGDIATFDLGAGAAAGRWPFVLEAAFADGTRAALRILHSDVPAQDPTATGALAAASGPYEWTAHHRYLHVRAVEASTIATVAAYYGDGVR